MWHSEVCTQLAEFRHFCSLWVSSLCNFYLFNVISNKASFYPYRNNRVYLYEIILFSLIFPLKRNVEENLV